MAPSPAAGDKGLPEDPGPYSRPGSTIPGPEVDYDVVVVGGGPAGSETARRLSGKGLNVLMLEEHRVLGEPVQCAGLIAKNVFPLIDLDAYGDFHQQEIRGAHIVAPSGRRVLVEAPEVHAHAVSRSRFDQVLSERAAAAGTEIVRGASYVDSRLLRSTSGVSSEGNGHGAVSRELTVRFLDEEGRSTRTTITCRLLVGADGVGSEVARTTGFGQAPFVLSGLEIELGGLDIPDPQNVHVHTGSHVAPGYFAWIVPNGPHGARVGLCLDIHRARGKSAWDCYQEYLRLPDVAKITKGGEETRRIVGCIPLGLKRSLADDGVVLVGDAGGFAKPTSGGGIYMASWGARLMERHLAPALEAGRTDAAALSSYTKAVHRSIGRELRVGAALHEVFRRLPDKEMDNLAEKLDDPGVLRTIERHGDIDHPSRLLLPVLMRRPSLLKYAWPATRALLVSRFQQV
jgi:digeranylgeranylglycerophospholipid reductase